MSMRPCFSALLLIPCLALPQARADIYIYQGAEGTENPAEIRLSNTPGMEGYQVLVEDPMPAPVQAAAEAGSATQATALPTNALPYDGAVRAAARETGLEPALIHAVIATESAHQAKAVSPRGARGLMQLMPDTARALRVNNPDNPDENILGGARYLRALLNEFGNLELALAAYNAGPAAVRNAGKRVPNFAETRRYVPRVLQHYRRLRQI